MLVISGTGKVADTTVLVSMVSAVGVFAVEETAADDDETISIQAAAHVMRHTKLADVILYQLRQREEALERKIE